MTKLFNNHHPTHGGLLWDTASSETSEPELEQLKASRKMNRDITGRIFAPFTRPEEQVLAYLTNKTP
ncbi:MAG: hypothetical protein H8E18_09625 [FCB group bacterium]|nr:hypothetical protein [FCB group bacterium]